MCFTNHEKHPVHFNFHTNHRHPLNVPWAPLAPSPSLYPTHPPPYPNPKHFQHNTQPPKKKKDTAVVTEQRHIFTAEKIHFFFPQSKSPLNQNPPWYVEIFTHVFGMYWGRFPYTGLLEYGEKREKEMI